MTFGRQWVNGSIVVFLSAILVVGCSSGDGEPAVTGGPTAKDSLTDLVSMLNHFKSENKKPPARMADVMPVEPIFQGAYLGLVRNEIVYVWGAPIDAAGSGKVLAYEKAVETGSGYVLMQDGTIKTMEAAEFNAAPKATK